MVKIICIDARFWGIKHTGIGRYVENLIDNLPIDLNVKIVLIVHPDQKDEPKLAGFTKYYAKFHPYSVAAQFEMLSLLFKIRPDLTHFTHFCLPVLWPGKFMVTIHDLIKHYWIDVSATTRNPVIYWIKQLGYRIAVLTAVKRAAMVIVPADYWKAELIKRYRLDPRKVTVTYEGVSEIFSQFSILNSQFSIKKPFVVYTGNLYPHKNVPILISAITKLKLNLAIVCARSVFVDRLPQSKYIHFLGRLTDEQLVSLYQQADAFVFPSLIEGFGLPGLEAMAVGLPVIAARASCLPEIYEEAALYFAQGSSDDLAQKIKLVIGDNKLRQDLISKGKKQISKYSWSKMAKETWQIYQQAIKN